MNDNWREIGAELMEHAADAEFTAQRGVVEELFPYIFMASRRMSLRAITRWLAEAHGVKISVVAIARAMRNAEAHWRELVEAVEPAARIFAEAHDLEPAEVLRNADMFFHFEGQPPKITEDLNGEPGRAIDEYGRACAALRNRWFAFPEEVRAQGWRYVAVVVDTASKEARKHAKRSARRADNK